MRAAPLRLHASPPEPVWTDETGSPVPFTNTAPRPRSPPVMGPSLGVGLRVEATQYQALFRHSLDAILLTAPDGRIMAANPAACALFQMIEEEICAGGRAAIVDPDDPRLALALEERSLTGAFRGELTMRRRRSGSFPAEVSTALFRGPDGRQFTSMIIRDASERVARDRQAQRQDFLAQAGAALASSLDVESTLAAVAQLAVPRMADVCLIDLVEDAGALERVAAAAREPWAAQIDALRGRYAVPDAASGVPGALRYGRSELTELLGHNLETAFPLLTSDTVRRHLATLRRMQPRSRIIVPLIARGHTLGALTFLTIASSARLYTAEDLALAEEIGRRAALAVENALLYRQARQAVDARDRLISTVSHDLRNSLTVMRYRADGLLMQLHDSAPAPDLCQRAAARILQLIDRLDQDIGDLLDATSLEQGKTLSLAHARGCLVALTRQIVADYQAGSPTHTLAIETAARSLVGDWDQRRIARVIGNLLSNAAKYSPPCSTILIRLARKRASGAAWAVLSIHDQGIGIPEQDLARVFTRFYRARNVRTTFPGTGIGLAGARQIVEQHGGRLELVSTEGVGTTATLWLPLAHRDRPPVPIGPSVSASVA